MGWCVSLWALTTATVPAKTAPSTARSLLAPFALFLGPAVVPSLVLLSDPQTLACCCAPGEPAGLPIFPHRAATYCSAVHVWLRCQRPGPAISHHPPARQSPLPRSHHTTLPPSTHSTLILHDSIITVSQPQPSPSILPLDASRASRRSAIDGLAIVAPPPRAPGTRKPALLPPSTGASSRYGRPRPSSISWHQQESINDHADVLHR